MTKTKIVYLTAIFFLMITGIRIVWYSLDAAPAYPRAIQGQLDLRNWDFNAKGLLTLDGEWEFYPGTWLIGNFASMPASAAEKSFLQVPGNWKPALSPKPDSALGFGTYHLRILIDGDGRQKFGIRVQNVPASSELFVDGRLLGQSGRPAPDAGQYEGRNVPYTAFFTTDSNQIDIVIQAANFDNKQQGGIIRSVKFGTEQAVSGKQRFTESMQLMDCVIFLMHLVYASILYLIGIRPKILLPFSLLIVSAILMVLVDDDKMLLIWVPLNYDWGARLLHLAFFGIAVSLLQMTKELLPRYSSVKAINWYSALCAAVALVILLIPTHYTSHVNSLFSFLILPVFLGLPVLMLRSAMKGDNEAIYLFFGVTALMTNSIWGVIKSSFWTGLNFYPLDLIVIMFAFAAFWFKRYFRNAVQMEEFARKLQQADKQKDDFLANTSHELRNPLHGILNIAQATLDNGKKPLDPGSAKNLELLITIGKRMSFTLNDLLDLTRLKENSIRLQMQSLSVQPVVSGVLDMLRFMTEDKPIRLHNHIPERFPLVAADENRLIQILFNLLHNAVKYTQEGTVTIQAYVQDGKAHIVIADTGIGMDEETRQRIFQPYEQGDSSITAIGGGIGLGLNIAKQLTELHGGMLQVKSAPGQGSAFTLSLRLADSSAQRHTATVSPIVYEAKELAAASGLPAANFAADAGSTRDRMKILIVDDDPVNLNILVNALSYEHYNTQAASSGKEALSLLASRSCDLVIADVMMPQMSGYELTRTIRDRFSMSELPILLLTARSRPEDIEAGFLAGANDYVTKPVDMKELRARVRALTGLKQSVRQGLRMEAAWLQAQIQPHFLFNVLNAISALSEIDTARMRGVLEAFGSYLQASFDFQNAEQLVPLEHELNLVRSYLFIEKERFEERLQIVWEVDEQLELLIPPLSIQPLVENAVKHGILNRSWGGTVLIRIADRGDHAEIAVVDNGVGINAETLQRILDRRPESGIGLRNTDRRLKQIYGRGLHIQSSGDRGTTVAFQAAKQAEARY